MLGGRVVVGVPEVARVDQAVEAGKAVDRKGAVVRREDDCHERIGEHDAPVGLLGGTDRVAEGPCRPGFPAEARYVLDADQHAPGRRLVEMHLHPGVRAEGEPGEEVGPDLGYAHVGRALREDAHGDVDALVVLLHVDSGDVGAVAHLVLFSDLGENASHLGRGEDEIGREPDPFVEYLGPFYGPLPADDELDHA